MTELGSIRDLLRQHGLGDATEEPFANDGWSGATLTRLRRGGGQRFILKRDSLARDWIARATNDRPVLREAWFAAYGPALPPGIRAGSIGAGLDEGSGEVGILMPDLTKVLFDWDTPISVSQLEHVLSALAEMHGFPWRISGEIGDGPWCPLRERVTLICRPSLERPGPAHDAVAERLLPGWDAWDRLASPAARRVVADLAEDPKSLLDELASQPATLIHGDLKLANIGIQADGSVVLVDWQMVSIAPVALELGWFLVSNVASLPLPPDEVIRRYQAKLAYSISDAEDDGRWIGGGELHEEGIDAAILVGLLLRGWRKGADAAVGITLASGVSAADDLAWWCERAVEAADRLF